MSSAIRKNKTARKKTRLKNKLRNPAKKARLIFLGAGLILTVSGLILSNSSEHLNEKVEAESPREVISFSQEPVKINEELLKVKSTKIKTKKYPPKRIIIPSIGIDINVKEAGVMKGYWEVFADSAGFGAGSAYPGETGNTVIFAHAREGLFLPLKNIKQTDKVYILTEFGFFVYEVANISEVLPTQTEVISPTTEATLTLYTCSGFADSKRLIISAKKINI